MKQHHSSHQLQSRIQKALSYVLTVMLILPSISPMVAFASVDDTAVQTPLSPSEQGVSVQSPQLPVTAFTDHDLTGDFMQQLIQDSGINMPTALQPEGVIRLESLDSPDSSLPLPPHVVDLRPQLPSIMPQNPADTDPSAVTPPTAEEENALNDEWPTDEKDQSFLLFPTNYNLASSAFPFGPSQLEDERPDEVASNWRFVRPQSVALPTGSMVQTHYFLPAAMTDGILPADETIVYPDQPATLMSTDGRIRVDIPAGAYEEPFWLRYTPPQELAGGFWSLEAVTMDGKKVELL